MGMTMPLRLSDEEKAALRDAAAREGRSMNDIARQAIREYTSGRQERLDTLIEEVVTRDATLLSRLGEA